VHFPGGKETVLHARSKEQVLEHLELLVEILDYRATMTVAQVRAQPLIVIYLEEFLLLKKELSSARHGSQVRQKNGRKRIMSGLCSASIRSRAVG
jgi:hypothetical protein